MKLTAVYLEPQNGYKTPLRSDTLWGILCWAIRSVHGEPALVKFIADYQGDKGALSLSSCFPYIELCNEQCDKKDNKYCKTHYFPLPQLYRDNPLKAETFDDCVREMTTRKDIKKNLTYVSQDLFEQILRGEKLPDDETLIKLAKPPAPASLPVTRNTINRIKGGTLERDGRGQLFHVDEHHLADKTGLFFLVKGDIKPLLLGALNYLSHAGFGGDRTVGKGWFKIHYNENFILNEPNEPNACTTLSLYHPNEKQGEIEYFEDDKFDEILNYTLELRGGRLGFFNYKQVRKDAILMFKEGSVFPIKKGAAQYGKNPIVLTPDPVNNPGLHHDVSHYGIGFMVKMNVESTK